MKWCRFAACCAAVLGNFGCAVSFAKTTAPQVLCHYTYGGEEKVLRVRPTLTPYVVEPTAVGSYFLFKVVLQTQPSQEAGINIYVYADKEPSPVPLSQVRYPYPPHTISAHDYGFTGLHWVYEPIRDGEMQYWCELLPKGQRQ